MSEFDTSLVQLNNVDPNAPDHVKAAMARQIQNGMNRSGTNKNKSYLDTVSLLAMSASWDSDRYLNQLHDAHEQNHRDGKVSADGYSQTEANVIYAAPLFLERVAEVFELSPHDDNLPHLQHEPEAA